MNAAASYIFNRAHTVTICPAAARHLEFFNLQKKKKKEEKKRRRQMGKTAAKNGGSVTNG